jgi:hypothetical protein
LQRPENRDQQFDAEFCRFFARKERKPCRTVLAAFSDSLLWQVFPVAEGSISAL